MQLGGGEKIHTQWENQIKKQQETKELYHCLFCLLSLQRNLRLSCAFVGLIILSSVTSNLHTIPQSLHTFTLIHSSIDKCICFIQIVIYLSINISINKVPNKGTKLLFLLHTYGAIIHSNYKTSSNLQRNFFIFFGQDH